MFQRVVSGIVLVILALILILTGGDFHTLGDEGYGLLCACR